MFLCDVRVQQIGTATWVIILYNSYIYKVNNQTNAK